MIWFAYAALTLFCVAVLIWPLLRSAGDRPSDLEADQAVYQAQLEEVERDLADGLLTDDQAVTARTDIKRRMLAAAGLETLALLSDVRGTPFEVRNPEVLIVAEKAA